MQIPLVDLAAMHAEVAGEIAAGFEEVIASGGFILGDPVARFERAFAASCGAAHCLGVANGTDALELAVRALGIGPGDEVILPANTFVATALAVSRAGATPVLADVDPEHLLIDPEAVRAAVTPRTKAVIAVHLYGQMAPLEELHRVASETGIAVIEDAAQAHGASRNGIGPGVTGAAAGFSFYPSKNLGGYGDGGGVVTNDDAVASRVRALRNYGSDRKYEHPEMGFNSRLDSMQAVVLEAKLARLGVWNRMRRVAADRYAELLAADERVHIPGTMPGNEHVWYVYVVRIPRRDEVLAALNAAGVGAAIHYPTPIHMLGAFASMGKGPGSFPVAERAAGEIVSLPMYPHITPEQQRTVADALLRALA